MAPRESNTTNEWDLKRAIMLETISLFPLLSFTTSLKDTKLPVSLASSHQCVFLCCFPVTCVEIQAKGVVPRSENQYHFSFGLEVKWGEHAQYSATPSVHIHTFADIETWKQRCKYIKASDTGEKHFKRQAQRVQKTTLMTFVCDNGKMSMLERE